MLRNGNGSARRAATEAALGLPACKLGGPYAGGGMVAADVDGDGDVDLIVTRHDVPNGPNGAVLLHLHRQVYAPAPPGLGMPFRVDLYGTPGHVFYLAFAAGEDVE